MEHEVITTECRFVTFLLPALAVTIGAWALLVIVRAVLTLVQRWRLLQQALDTTADHPPTGKDPAR
jgi:hypothetical protein